MRGEIIIVALTPLGHWFVDVATLLPLGDPVLRPARLAMILGAIAITLLAWALTRRGTPLTVAAGCALIVAFEPTMWTRLTTAPEAALATLCVVASAGVVLLGVGVISWRLTRGAALVVVAVAVAPLATAAATLSVTGAFIAAILVARLPLSMPGRTFLLGALVLVLAADRLTAPPAETWRLLVWRDAVERALPAGATVATGSRATAALNGALFRGRPAGVQIVYGAPDGIRQPPFVLNDLRPQLDPSGGIFRRVHLALPGPDELIAHLPAGTIVGIAVSGLVAADAPDSLLRALRRLGRAVPVGRAGLVTIGVSGSRPEPAEAPASAMQLMIGEAIPGTTQRSPTDVELSATETAVDVRFRGRDLVAGAGWAIILIDPRGPLLDAYSAAGVPMAIPAYVEGLQLWRKGD